MQPFKTSRDNLSATVDNLLATKNSN
jgi:hypothetical protein